jgi:hypothetical protein
MSTRAVFPVVDYDGEQSSTKIWVQDIGAGNYAAVTQDIDELKDAILTLILGNVLYAGFSKQFPENPAQVTDQDAQREAKWLVTYRDTLQFLDAPTNVVANTGYGKVFNVEIPCANLNLLTGNVDSIDLTAGVGLAFKTAFEANARSPYNHTSTAASGWVELLEVRHVGRRT